MGAFRIRRMETSARLVMTIMAKDRPGLVELVSGLVAEHGGNWLESRMAHLGGQFAGILRIEVPGENRAKLEGALKGLTGQGITVLVESGGAAEAGQPGAVAELKIVGHDRPGIVRQVAQALARYGVNVEELSTECVSAPMSGEPLFQAEARVQLPPNCSAEEVSGALEKIANDLMVDLTFHRLERKQ